MKSLKKVIAGLFLSVLTLSLYAAPKTDYLALGTESTPENSVVLIYMGDSSTLYFQVNPEFKHNTIDATSRIYCTVPLEPGSCYIKNMVDTLMYTAGALSVPSEVSFIHYLNSSNITSRIVIPTKPGLYLFDGKDYFSEADQDEIFEKLTKSRTDRKAFKSLVNKAAKLYEGTDWEPLFDDLIERIEEVE